MIDHTPPSEPGWENTLNHPTDLHSVLRRPPSFIGPYPITRELGRGGMGVVYLARHPLLERDVAVKVLPGARYSTPEAVARLIREAKIGASIRHPGVCQILDAGQADGDFYFVMEFLPGPTLRDLIRSRGPLPIEEACGYAAELFEVLAEFARRGIVHRDVKSSNLMLGADGRLRLLDLGLAKDLADPDSMPLTRTGVVMGTPAWMPPEQLRHAGLVSPASDLYAGGVILFELLTGRLPFEGGTVENYFSQILYGDVPRVHVYRDDVPAPIDLLVSQLLAKDRDARPDHEHTLDLLKQFAGSPSSPTRHNVKTSDSGNEAIDTSSPSVLTDFRHSRRSFPARVLAAFRSGCSWVLGWFAQPRIPPAPPISSTENSSQFGTIRRSAVLMRLAEACGQLQDPANGELEDLLPQEDGKPCVGHYRLDRRLDEGTAPVRTYLARQVETEVACVVRILPLALATLAPDKLGQLRKTRGRLVELTQRSPHLARLITVEKAKLNRGNFTTLYYTVEDFVSGRSVEEDIRSGRALTPAAAKDYLRQAIEGLGALHAQPILHGNLHPGKIFIDPARGHLSICDWSHACEYRADAAAGPDPATQAIHGVDLIGDKSEKRRRYLAPEVLYGAGEPGPGAEQYALGVLFLEALVGRFTSDGGAVDQNDYRRAVDRQDFLDKVAELDNDLARVLRRMTNLDAARRYPTFGAALEELNPARPTRPDPPQSPPINPPQDKDVPVSGREERSGPPAQPEPPHAGQDRPGEEPAGQIRPGPATAPSTAAPDDTAKRAVEPTSINRALDTSFVSLSPWSMSTARLICDAFDEDELAAELSERLGVSLDVVTAAGKPYEQRVTGLLRWAQRHGRLKEVVAALAAARPHRHDLRNLAVAYQG